MKYLLFITTVILFSCSPIKRHARIVKKFPYVHTTDSIKLIDTVRLFTTAVEVDTVVGYKALEDGVVINKDNLRVEIIKIHDSIYINGSCDTIYLEKIITRKIPIRYYKEPLEYKNFIFLLIALLIGLYIFKGIK